jgi:sRNA-binding protein
LFKYLTRVSAGQERAQQTGIFCGKALLLTSSGARVQERETRARARERKRTRKQEKREQESKKKNKRERKKWQNPVPFKENYPPPRTYYSLIGCSPSAQLSSRERQNTWRENCPCTCADYVYYLEHSCQRHLVMANVRAAPNINSLQFKRQPFL